MPRFLLLPRDDGTAFAAMSPAEMESIIGRYIAWSEGLKTSGRLVQSDKLRDGEGRVVTRRDGGMVVTDGPFCEVREVVGGYWIVEAADYADAERLCAACPHLEYGTMEIRQVEVL